MAVAALLFDLDGTLVDSERESAEAMARALRDGQGIEISQAQRDFIIGRSWQQIYQNLQSAHPQMTWTRDQLIAATAEARVEVFAETGITILPGAVEAVRRFSDIPRALVTGSSRVEAAQALEATGLACDFDVVLASEDYPRSKPDPVGYLNAAQTLGVPVTECVVIEDSSAGIAAGRAAGAWVVAVSVGNFDGQDQSHAHRIIRDLHELTPQLLLELPAAP